LISSIPYFYSNFQGILSNVTLNKNVLTNWKMYPYGFLENGTMSTLFDLVQSSISSSIRSSTDVLPKAPAFYTVSFAVGQVKDTFMKLDQWTKVC